MAPGVLVAPGARVVARRDASDAWALPAATLCAVALHAGLIGLIMIEWPTTDPTPTELPVRVELVLETPPAQAPRQQPPESQPFRQSGGDPNLAPGRASAEPPALETPTSPSVPEPPADFAGSTPLPARKPPVPRKSELAAMTPSRDERAGKGGGDRYLNLIRDEILSQRDYPAVAVPMQLAGTPHYEIVINRLGMLVSAELVRTSGVGALDEVGLGMIRRAAPFPPVPDTIKGDQILLGLTLYIGP